MSDWPTSAKTAAMLGGGNQRQAGREPVEPVDEVEGIRDADDPQHRERAASQPM